MSGVPALIPISGQLDVTVVGAKHLDDVRLMTSMSPALALEWNQQRLTTPPHKSGGTKPKWNHSFAPLQLVGANPTSSILIEVSDNGKDVLGSVTMSIAQFLARVDHANKLVGGDKQVHLILKKKDGTEKGDVYLACQFTRQQPQQQPRPQQVAVNQAPQAMKQPPQQPAPAPMAQAVQLQAQPSAPFVQTQPPMQMHQPSVQPQYAMQQQQPQPMSPMMMQQPSYPMHSPPPGTVMLSQPLAVGYVPMQPYSAQPGYYPPPQQQHPQQQIPQQMPQQHPQQQMPPQSFYPNQMHQVLSAPVAPVPMQQHPSMAPAAWQPAASADDGVFPFSELKITRLIGEGMFGTVSAGEFRSTPVAVKQLKQTSFSPAQWQEFMDEVKFLREARHPNIVLFMGVCFQPPCLVTELLDTSLFDVLYKAKQVLTNRQKVHIALGVARGLASLHGHSPPIVHRDVKSLNILVSSDLVSVKICDLGMVKFKAAQGQRLEASGTPNWMAPEVLLNQAYDEQADVYSYGCVLYELLSGTVPYAGAEFTRDRIAERVGKGDRPQLPKGLEKPWQDLLVACWQQHPQSRPTMKRVVEMITAIPV